METSDELSATSLTVDDNSMKTMVLMIEAGRSIENGREVHSSSPLSIEIRPRLATVSGRPFASKKPGNNAHLPRGFKVGLVQLHSNELRDRQHRGGSTIVTRDFGPVFETDLKTSVKILSEHGFRTSGPEEDKWIVYEVGGPLEHEVALWLAERGRVGENSSLISRAREICPGALGEEAPERKKGK
jgi:hypothetical protein